jgi:hypothetical protein
MVFILHRIPYGLTSLFCGGSCLQQARQRCQPSACTSQQLLRNSGADGVKLFLFVADALTK